MKLLKWLWANKWHELGHPAGVLALAYLAGAFWPETSTAVQLLVGWIPNMAYQLTEPMHDHRPWLPDDGADIASLQVVWPLLLLPDLPGAIGLLGAILMTYLLFRVRSLA